MHHHKEANPIETIKEIRNILADISILPTEKWHNYIDGLYSLRLTIPQITQSIGVNGKGINREFALASAYGELMERMQNQLLYPLFMYYDFDDELRKIGDFEFDPNERRISTEEIIKNIPYEIVNLLSDEVETFIKSFSGRVNETSICLPYYHYNSGKTIFFPKDSFFYYYGSNGMAAGNTLEEAIVQGLSEIFERHVMRAALYENVSFPEIEFSILQNSFPEEFKIIQKIEKSTEFMIKVLDCSMNCFFPVIGIIVANNKTHKHFVRFGSHPDLHIALERCLTELLQGRNISDLNNMIDFKFLKKIEDGKENINFHNIFRDGWGYYPNSFFVKESDFTINPTFLSKKYYSNSESLASLLKVIDTQGWQLLVRDVGFLKFPAVSLCVPGISEVSRIDEQNVYSLHEARETAMMLKKVSRLDNEQKDRIIEMSKYQGMVEIKPDIIQLMNLPIDRSHPFAKVNTTLLSALIYFSKGEIEKALDFIDIYIDHMGVEIGAEALSYFRCARNYLLLLQNPDKQENYEKVLGFFFKIETVEKVIKEFSSPDYLLKTLGILDCPNCENCSVSSSCSYSVIRNIHIRLKMKMKENPINQNDIGKIFNMIEKHSVVN